ncbi:glycosyltransferase family 2 protein [Peribacillus sp. B-H-3]|uniref:glycosyltransferase family 2 protein n=1 Tax=Peribacillus sp. B-H-3 TaxID=3400420 RepID=UPI003B013528
MSLNGLVSIIVPVYNAENYLARCIDTILNQTYKNIEVILVNDGSVDKSGCICEEYSNLDTRIKVIHQNNLGPSQARNIGLNSAKGKFIQFIDSDDTVELNITEKLVHEINLYNEMVICGYKLISNKKKTSVVQKISPQKEGVFQFQEFLKYFGKYYKNNLINSPCNKLYVTEIIKKNNLQFNNDINMGEDFIFNLSYMRYCNNISIIGDNLYNYLKLNDNSLTLNFKNGLFENQKFLFEKVRIFLCDYNSYTADNEKIIETYYTDSIINCFNNLFHKNNDLTFLERKEEIKAIINDERVREKNEYFNKGNVKKRYIGWLIKNRLIYSIYFYYRLKRIVRKIKE